ncbi:aldehyde dehydrogenase family protein [Pantoea vagans]|uniref:aldehyde dehydrogenase family protein n=1 Tax=Pantoea vagans TaxID=470934 RepID=UPI00301AC863
MSIVDVNTHQVRRYGHWIEGAETATDQFIDRVSPESGAIVAQFAKGTDEEAKQAVESAKLAFEAGPWPRLSSTQRATLLNKWADAIEAETEMLIRIEVEESGKIYRVAKGDIEGSISLIRYAAALAVQMHGQAFTQFGGELNAMVVHEPVGVVGAIVPWNFPTIIFAQKVPFALAAGCTVVVKPSELTSGSAVELARLASQVGIPAAVLNVVTGLGDPVGKHLVNSPDVDMISFTGSTATGLHVLQGQLVNFKRVSLELGGKSAAIVLDDCDLEAAVDGVMFSIFLHQGQVCCAGSRLLVQDTIADVFLKRLLERISALNFGPLMDSQTDIGPLVSDVQLSSVQKFISRAREQGAEVLCGGNKADSSDRYAKYPGAARTVLPTVLDNVKQEMAIFDEEAFGPVLAVTRFRSEDEAVRLANASKYGLAGSVWSKDFNKAFAIASAVRTGTIEINTSLEGQPQLPFGGYKTSGIGREKGLDGLMEFTETKTIGFRSTPRKPFFAG